MRTGDRLRMARNRLRMTQKELAGDDFHRSLISQIETGLIEPSLHTLTVLADRVGLPTSFFVESAGERQRTQAAVAAAEALLAQRDYDGAYKVLMDNLPLVASFGLKAQLLLFLGRVLLLQGRSAEALTFLQASQGYLRIENDVERLTRALLYSGHALSDLERYREAIDALSEAMWLLEHAVLPADRAARRTVRSLAVAVSLAAAQSWAHLDDDANALAWLERAADLATDADQVDDLGRAHQMMAFVHHQFGRYEEAEHHNRLALSLLDAARPVEHALCLAYTAHRHGTAGRPEDAAALYGEVCAALECHPEYLFIPYQGLAVEHFTARRYAQAADWARRTVALLREEAPAGQRACRHANLVQLLVLLAHFDAGQDTVHACPYLKQGLEWFRTKGFVHILWRAMNHAQWVAKEQGEA